MALTNKQSAFVSEYLIDFNATQAAIRAGYSENTARAIGHENLTKPDIEKEIKKHVSECAMSADEALVRLAEQARADYSMYISDDGHVDLLRMIDDGKVHLIKCIKETQHARNIEFYDAQSALFKIIEIHGLLKQVHEHSGPGGGPQQHEYRIRDMSNEQLERLANGGDSATG